MLGWFNGPGFAATLEMFKKQMGIPRRLRFLRSRPSSSAQLASSWDV
jgi:hypothetical protein